MTRFIVNLRVEVIARNSEEAKAKAIIPYAYGFPDMSAYVTDAKLRRD